MEQHDDTRATDRPAMLTGQAARRTFWPATRSRWLRASLAGVVVAGAVVALRLAGVLDGAIGLVAAAVIALALPLSRSLSRRILLSGSILIGWLPLLWWLRLPLGGLGRMGLVLALTAGALMAWVLAAAAPRERARLLLPRLAGVDALAPLAGLLAVWATWPLLTSPSGERTLNLFVKSGWDHVAHFDMVLLTRQFGEIVPALGAAPDGTPWAFSTYPGHFHAVASALTELLTGPDVGGALTELLHYGRALALLQTLAAVLIAAGIAQLPRMNRRPVSACALAGLLLAAFLFGPGSVAMVAGYANFFFACLAIGLTVLVALPMTGELQVRHALALGGLVVASFHGWTLLGPLAVAGCCIGFLPFARDRLPHSRAGIGGLLIVLAATLAAVLLVIPLILGSGGAGIMTAPGLPQYSMSQLLLSGGAALALCLLMVARRHLYMRSQATKSSER